MAYVTPPTFVASTTLAAADLNILGTDIVYLKGQTDAQAFKGIALNRLTTTQSIPASTYTPVNWLTAPVMVGGTWWVIGTPDSITVPTGTVASGYTNAIIECQASITFAANNNYSRGVAVSLNGTTVEAGEYVSAINGDTTTVTLTVWALAADGDVLKVLAWQSSGGALNIANNQFAHFRVIGYV